MRLHVDTQKGAAVLFGKKKVAVAPHSLEQFRQAWFPHSDDAVWQAWVDMEEQDYRSLTGLLADPAIQDTFKARALIVLFALNQDNLPVYWKRNRSSFDSVLLGSAVKLDGLSTPLLRFVAELLIHACDAVANQPADFNSDRVFWTCNSYILQLLKMLPVEEAERIWPHYQLNDPTEFANIDDASGYNPWSLLMGDRAIPMHWKRLADDRLRQIIDLELAGSSRPREEWENALRCYVLHLNSLVFGVRDGGELPYDVDLLADQIRFILSKGAAVDRVVVKHYNLTTVMHLLWAEEHQDLRQQVVRAVLNQPGYPFRIYDNESLSAAIAMATSLVDRDDPAVVELDRMIDAALPEIKRKEDESRRKAERKQHIHDQMKA